MRFRPQLYFCCCDLWVPLTSCDFGPASNCVCGADYPRKGVRVPTVPAGCQAGDVTDLGCFFTRLRGLFTGHFPWGFRPTLSSLGSRAFSARSLRKMGYEVPTPCTPQQAPRLSPQLSPPQMRPLSHQPPALPCGRPQDRLGNQWALLPALFPSGPLPRAVGQQRLEGRTRGTGPSSPALPARPLSPQGIQPSSFLGPLSYRLVTGSVCVGLLGLLAATPQHLPGAVARSGSRAWMAKW